MGLWIQQLLLQSPYRPALVLARSDLLDLAKFRDTSGYAVSFFFSLQSIPDKSHHTEVTLVRDLVREEKLRVDIKQAPGRLKTWKPF